MAIPVYGPVWLPPDFTEGEQPSAILAHTDSLATIKLNGIHALVLAEPIAVIVSDGRAWCTVLGA